LALRAKRLSGADNWIENSKHHQHRHAPQIVARAESYVFSSNDGDGDGDSGDDDGDDSIDDGDDGDDGDNNDDNTQPPKSNFLRPPRPARSRPSEQSQHLEWDLATRQKIGLVAAR
jgi:hypothetical protein